LSCIIAIITHKSPLPVLSQLPECVGRGDFREVTSAEVTSAFESWRVFRHTNCYLVVSATVVSAFDIYPSHDSSSDM
jgi:hypothetical protein